MVASVSGLPPPPLPSTPSRSLHPHVVVRPTRVAPPPVSAPHRRLLGRGRWRLGRQTRRGDGGHGGSDDEATVRRAVRPVPALVGGAHTLLFPTCSLSAVPPHARLAWLRARQSPPRRHRAPCWQRAWHRPRLEPAKHPATAGAPSRPFPQLPVASPLTASAGRRRHHAGRRGSTDSRACLRSQAAQGVSAARARGRRTRGGVRAPERSTNQRQRTPRYDCQPGGMLTTVLPPARAEWAERRRQRRSADCAARTRTSRNAPRWCCFWRKCGASLESRSAFVCSQTPHPHSVWPGALAGVPGSVQSGGFGRLRSRVTGRQPTPSPAATADHARAWALGARPVMHTHMHTCELPPSSKWSLPVRALVQTQTHAGCSYLFKAPSRQAADAHGMAHARLGFAGAKRWWWRWSRVCECGGGGNVGQAQACV